jgi:hypothetical protein
VVTLSMDGLLLVVATPSAHDRPPKKAPKGRVCEHPGCFTILSVYNLGRYCAVHEHLPQARVRGKKIA